MRKALHECTLEKHGDGAGQRSASRTVLMAGLFVFGLILIEAQVAVLGVALDWWKWSAVEGYFKWISGFTGGTVLPYVGKHVMAGAKAAANGGLRNESEPGGEG